MAAAGESVGADDRDGRFHQEIRSLGQQQVESLQEIKSLLSLQQVESLQEMKSLGLQQAESLGKVEALLKVLVELQTQIVRNPSVTTTINYNNNEEKNKASQDPAPSIDPLHKPALASTSSILLTPEEDTITTTAASDSLSANMKMPFIMNDNQEITQVINEVHNDQVEESEDGGQGMSTDVLDGYKELHKAEIKGHWDMARMVLKKKKNKASEDPSPSFDPLHKPVLASKSSTLLTPEENTITTDAASDNLTANIERSSTVNYNQEITQVIDDDHSDQVEESAEDVGQVMSTDVLDGYKELYYAAIDGDWNMASKFFEEYPEAITKVITSDSRTVLHVAIIQGNLEFTKEIVKLMPPEILEYKTSTNGYTALHYAAMCGFPKAAKLLVRKNSKLTQIEDGSKRIPLLLALISVTGRQRGTVEYLYSETRHHHPSHFSVSMLRHTIDAGYYGIASSLVQRFPELVIDQKNEVQRDAMNNMAERPFAFASGAKHTFLQRRIYSLIKVDINTSRKFDAQAKERSSEESLAQSLEVCDEDEKNSDGWEVNVALIICGVIAGAILLAWAIICIILGLIYFTIKLIYDFLAFLWRFIVPSSPVVKVEINLDESHPQSLEGTNGDEENPVKRTKGSSKDQINPPENSENTEGEKTKGINIEDTFLITLFLVAVPPLVLLYLIYFVIKFSVRFIWSPVSHIKQTYKQVCDDKVKHKEAEALVKNIFTTLKERMNKGEVIDFFERSNFMEMAIRHASAEIVEVCIKLFPYLIWTQMGGQNMLQMAIAERNETILNIICEESGRNKIDLVCRVQCDDKGNTILHYAAKLAPSAKLNSVSGAYLQMQREKHWFKGVENMIPEMVRFKRNNNGDTAHDVFTKEHKELKESGEKWLKDTAGSCMLVAALIATMAFASAFTVPGGNISDSNSGKNGIPVLLTENPFIVFALADALALFSSITSVLMFLAIHTSRYAENDFLKSLPNKFILGLATLFMSMASVLVAFGASLYIVLGERFTWVLVPIVVFSCVPVTLFGWLQLPLFFDMTRSTYWGSLFREHTYLSSLQLNSRREKHYNKSMTSVGFWKQLFFGNLICSFFDG